MEFRRCYGCMRTLPSPGAKCPNCGYDNTTDPKKQPNHALPCGTWLHGKYIIGKVLGQGGFGLTYIGWDVTLETSVCIKEYFPNGAAMRDCTHGSAVYWSSGGNAGELRQGQESFLKEARKAVRLRDLRSVVTVWDVFSENETSYIVMEYIEGVNLKTYLQQRGRGLGEAECVRLLSPVMADLEEVHRRGIIHRDISPDNLLLRADGTVVLLDLGAAKDLSGGSSQSSFLVAKHGFSPMEQYTRNSEIGPWTDVYAMCATVVYCVTGRLLPEPFERLMGKELDLSGISPAFREVLEHGLAVRSEDRFQSMGELREALTEAARRAEQDKLQDAQQEWDYQAARTLMEHGDISSLTAARKLLTGLTGYRDAEALAADCAERIGRLREKPRETASGKAATPEKKPTGKKLLIPLLAAAVVLIGAAVFFGRTASAEKSDAPAVPTAAAVSAIPAATAAPVVKSVGTSAGANELDAIKAAGVLTVAISPDFSPLEFVDKSKTGQAQYVGFDVSLAEYIAQELGVKLEIRAMSFDACQTAVAKDEVDMSISGYTWTADRAENYEVSDSYYAGLPSSVEQVLLIRAADAKKYSSAEDFTGVTVGAQTASLQQQLVMGQLPDAKLQVFDKLEDGVRALRAGSIEAMAVAIDYAYQAVTDNPNLAVCDWRFTLIEAYEDNVILMRKGETALLAAVNAALDKAYTAGYYIEWYDAALELAASENAVELSLD